MTGNVSATGGVNSSSIRSLPSPISSSFSSISASAGTWSGSKYS